MRRVPSAAERGARVRRKISSRSAFVAARSARRSALGFARVRSCGRIVPVSYSSSRTRPTSASRTMRRPALGERLAIGPERGAPLLLEDAAGEPVGLGLRGPGVRVGAVLLRVRDADDVLGGLCVEALLELARRSGRTAARRRRRVRARGSRAAKSESNETVAIPWRGILRPSSRADVNAGGRGVISAANTVIPSGARDPVLDTRLPAIESGIPRRYAPRMTASSG